ncbi:helix-turn-helix transcriptional regulator [Shewanella gaetbuli]
MKVLRLPDVIASTSLSRASIYAGMKQGSFPASISLGPNKIGWLESEVNDWIQEKINKRDSAI